MPKISVIVPVYNVEKYIGDCLNSLVHQTLSDIEIIVVDDCGTDKSVDIIESFARSDKRIKVYKNEKNMGISVTRNLGLSKSSADYIMFVDSDDMVKPTMCEQLYNRITKDNLDIVMCGVNLLFESENDKTRIREDYFNIPNENNISYGIYDTDSFACTVWNKIYRRSIIVNHDVYFPVGLKNEDECFSRLYALWTKKAGLIKDKLYIYRIRSESIMGNMSKSNKLENDIFLCAKFIYQYMIEHDKYDSEYFWRFFVKSVFTSIERTSNKKLHKIIVTDAKDFVKQHYKNDINDSETKYFIDLILNKHFQTRKKYLFGLIYVKYSKEMKYVSICGIRVLKQRLTKKQI